MPVALPPHQDPQPQQDPSKVSMLEYVTSIVATLDRRFDTLHQDLKELINARLLGTHQVFDRQFADSDLRYQQRFDQQQIALNAALAAQKEAIATALTAAEKATTKSETASEKRFECVAADTPILCADLVWRPAGDLLVGDELVACDEVSLTRRGRRYCRAVVTHNSLARAPLMLVVTPMGRVRCTYNHPWLVRRGPAKDRPSWQWMRTDEMRPGDMVMHALDVWQIDRSWEAGWLAGMFDGEGCLTLDRNRRTQLSLTQRESPTSDLIEMSLKSRVEAVGSYRVEAGRHKHTQPFYHFMVTRLPDVLTLLGSVRPPRLLAKSGGAWESKPLGAWGRATTVTVIESAGTGNIARLSTSTYTYIAEGFAMHNSVNEFRAQLSDQAATFMPRSESEARMAALQDKLEDLKTSRDTLHGKGMGQSQLWGLVVGAIGLVATLTSMFVLVSKL